MNERGTEGRDDRAGRRRIDVPLGLLLVLAIAIAGPACTAGHPKEGPPSRLALPTSPTALPVVDLVQLKQMLASARGTPVLLNVWASWCGPCIKEAPALASLSKEFSGKVTFVGLDVEDTTPNARAFVTKYGWTFPSLADPTGQVRNGLGFVGQPVTVVFDAAGKQVFALSGPITEAQLRGALARLP